MPKTRTAPALATEPKTHRSATTANKKPARVPPLPPHIPEFDATAHRKEIAQVAYRMWLERADGPGSPEEDWLQAEAEVRVRYTH